MLVTCSISKYIHKLYGSWTEQKTRLTKGSTVANLQQIPVRNTYLKHVTINKYKNSFCKWLYVLYIFVSFCKLYILIVMFMYYCYVCSVVYIVFIPATLTEVLPCFFLSCKANARVYLAKMGHGLRTLPN